MQTLRRSFDTLPSVDLTLKYFIIFLHTLFSRSSRQAYQARSWQAESKAGIKGGKM